jgi:hypothetical protein
MLSPLSLSGVPSKAFPPEPRFSDLRNRISAPSGIYTQSKAHTFYKAPCQHPHSAGLEMLFVFWQSFCQDWSWPQQHLRGLPDTHWGIPPAEHLLK